MESTLRTIYPERDNDFVLREQAISIECAEKEFLVVTDRHISVRRCSIRWEDELRDVWLDEHQWPIKLRRKDGLTAIETQYVRCI